MPITRRRFLTATGSLVGAGVVSPLLGRIPAWADATADLRPISMAMHIHASFSEGIGSMEAQLTQAAANQVDVVWRSEHDWRMSAYGYRGVVHFDAMTEKEDGLPWTWVPRTSGSLSESSGRIVTTPSSPLDPSVPGSLRVTATSKGSSVAVNR